MCRWYLAGDCPGKQVFAGYFKTYLKNALLKSRAFFLVCGLCMFAASMLLYLFELKSSFFALCGLWILLQTSFLYLFISAWYEDCNKWNFYLYLFFQDSTCLRKARKTTFRSKQSFFVMCLYHSNNFYCWNLVIIYKFTKIPWQSMSNVVDYICRRE